MNQTTKSLGLKNILLEYPAITKHGILSKTFSHFSQAYQSRSFNYIQVAHGILQDDRVQDAVEKASIQQFKDADSNEDEYYQYLWKNNEKRAKKLLKDLRSTMSDFLLKYVL